MNFFRHKPASDLVTRVGGRWSSFDMVLGAGVKVHRRGLGLPFSAVPKSMVWRLFAGKLFGIWPGDPGGRGLLVIES